jgi:type II secretory pathway pseudopilin PulG
MLKSRHSNFLVYFLKSQNRREDLGFTLNELLMSIAMSSVVLGAMGFGLVATMRSDIKTDNKTQQRTNVSRAIDFITEDIRMASAAATTEPTWAPASPWASGWLGSSGTPEAKLYLQVPLAVDSMKADDDPATTGVDEADYINLPDHEFNDGNVVRFSGTGTIAGGLSKNTVYYVVNRDSDRFKVSTSPGGTAVDLTSDSSGSLVAEKLIIYYLRDNAAPWLQPKTVNRALGPCSTASNCQVLIHSIKPSNPDAACPDKGFDVAVNNNEVTLTLTAIEDDKDDGDDNTLGILCSKPPITETSLSSKAWTRSGN